MYWHNAIIAAVLALLAAGSAQAQQIYRIVGPDGKVTFTDKPPVPDGRSKISTVASSIPAGSANTANLPFELRAIANKYPVTLYTTENCAVCAIARNYLIGRGIPFAEKTVNSPDEVEAFVKISGSTQMPHMSIGSQQLSNFNEADWGQYLSAAAYPASSALPPNYKYAPAAPIIQPKEAPPSPSEPASGRPEDRPSSPSVAPAPSNPAGIRF